MIKKVFLCCVSFAYILMGSSIGFCDENINISSKKESIQKQIQDFEADVVKAIRECIQNKKGEYRVDGDVDGTDEDFYIMSVFGDTLYELSTTNPELVLALISYFTTKENLVEIMNKVGLDTEVKVLGYDNRQISLFELVLGYDKNNPNKKNEDPTIAFYSFIDHFVSRLLYLYFDDLLNLTQKEQKEDGELIGEALKRAEAAVSSLPEDILYDKKVVTRIKAQIVDSIYYTDSERFVAKIIERMNHPYNTEVFGLIFDIISDDFYNVMMPIDVAKAILRVLDKEEAFRVFNLMVSKKLLLDPIKDYLQQWLVDLKGNTNIKVVQKDTLNNDKSIIDELENNFHDNDLEKFLDNVRLYMKTGSTSVKGTIIDLVCRFIKEGDIQLRLTEDYPSSLTSISYFYGGSDVEEAVYNYKDVQTFIDIFESLNLTSTDDVIRILDAMVSSGKLYSGSISMYIIRAMVANPEINMDSVAKIVRIINKYDLLPVDNVKIVIGDLQRMKQKLKKPCTEYFNK